MYFLLVRKLCNHLGIFMDQRKSGPQVKLFLGISCHFGALSKEVLFFANDAGATFLGLEKSSWTCPNKSNRSTSSAELTQQNEAQNKPFWVFPKIMGFPPKSSISNRVFPSFSPSILGGFPAILGNPHIFPSVLLRYFVAPKLQEQWSKKWTFRICTKQCCCYLFGVISCHTSSRATFSKIIQFHQ